MRGAYHFLRYVNERLPFWKVSTAGLLRGEACAGRVIAALQPYVQGSASCLRGRHAKPSDVLRGVVFPHRSSSLEEIEDAHIHDAILRETHAVTAPRHQVSFETSTKDLR